jgi:hypothetical protein
MPLAIALVVPTLTRLMVMDAKYTGNTVDSTPNGSTTIRYLRNTVPSKLAYVAVLLCIKVPMI